MGGQGVGDLRGVPDGYPGFVAGAIRGDDLVTDLHVTFP